MQKSWSLPLSSQAWTIASDSFLGFLVEPPETAIHPKTTAWVLMRVQKHEHITPILCTRHWFPVSTQNNYKILLVNHKCITGPAPTYLQESSLRKSAPAPSDPQAACSSKSQRPVLTTTGDQAFSPATPCLWHSLPTQLRAQQNLDLLKTGLITFFYLERLFREEWEESMLAFVCLPFLRL